MSENAPCRADVMPPSGVCAWRQRRGARTKAPSTLALPRGTRVRRARCAVYLGAIMQGRIALCHTGVRGFDLPLPCACDAGRNGKKKYPRHASPPGATQARHVEGLGLLAGDTKITAIVHSWPMAYAGRGASDRDASRLPCSNCGLSELCWINGAAAGTCRPLVVRWPPRVYPGNSGFTAPC